MTTNHADKKLSIEERAHDTRWDEPISDPELAAYGLREGREVDYQPGDGTRYLVCIASFQGTCLLRWLIFLNLNNAVVPLERKLSPYDYARLHHAPVGSWMALRPLLAALKRADGSFVMDTYDSRAEAAARKGGDDGEPLNHLDAILGRAVRRIVVDQSHQGMPPGGEPVG